MASARKARVFRNDRGQAVRIPDEYRFATEWIYIERDPTTGALLLSEKPPRPSLDEVFAALDAAGGRDFDPTRDFPPDGAETLMPNP